MLAGHSLHFDSCPLTLFARCDVEHHFIVEVQVIHLTERFLFTFRLQAALSVRCCYNGEIASEALFHLLIEVVCMVVGKENDIDRW